MSRAPSTLLGFDYGEKKIGVAVGQTLTGTASPVCSVAVRKNVPDWSSIDKLVRTWQPNALVVGIPVHMDGTEQPMTTMARRFLRQLRSRFGLPVHTADERLSTREARERLQAAGRADDDDDPISAQVILEGWLAAND